MTWSHLHSSVNLILKLYRVQIKPRESILIHDYIKLPFTRHYEASIFTSDMLPMQQLLVWMCAAILLMSLSKEKQQKYFGTLHFWGTATTATTDCRGFPLSLCCLGKKRERGWQRTRQSQTSSDEYRHHRWAFCFDLITSESIKCWKKEKKCRLNIVSESSVARKSFPIRIIHGYIVICLLCIKGL